MAEPIVFTRHAVEQSPTLRDLYLRLQRARKVYELSVGMHRAPALAAVEALEGQITAFLGGRRLEILEEEV